MKTRRPQYPAILCALIFSCSAAPLFAQQTLQPRDDSDEYAPRNPETGHYTSQPDSAYVDTSLQNNLIPPPLENTIEPTDDQPETVPHIPPTAVDLISPIELHVATHRLTANSTYGFDIGLQAAYYFNETMLDGWNGFDLAFRLGHLQRFSLLARLVTPWTLINTPNLNLAAGPGAEYSTQPTYAGSTNSPYLSLLLSVRLGLTAGPIHLRTEYDFHAIRQAHHLRAYLPLPYYLGIGLELAFNRDNSPNLLLNQTAATIFLHF